MVVGNADGCALAASREAWGEQVVTSKRSAPSFALALRVALSCGYVAWDRFFRVRVIP